MQITVIHTLDPKIIDLFERFTAGGVTRKQDAVAIPAPVTAEAPVAEAQSAEVSLEQVRAAVQEKAQSGKRDKVKSLLSEFGAENVTKLDKAKYAEFLTALKAL